MAHLYCMECTVPLCMQLAQAIEMLQQRFYLQTDCKRTPKLEYSNRIKMMSFVDDTIHLNIDDVVQKYWKSDTVMLVFVYMVYIIWAHVHRVLSCYTLEKEPLCTVWHHKFILSLQHLAICLPFSPTFYFWIIVWDGDNAAWRRRVALCIILLVLSGDGVICSVCQTTWIIGMDRIQLATKLVEKGKNHEYKMSKTKPSPFYTFQTTPKIFSFFSIWLCIPSDQVVAIDLSSLST